VILCALAAGGSALVAIGGATDGIAGVGQPTGGTVINNMSVSNCAGRELFVRGIVVREIDEHAYQGAVVFGPESFGRIALRPVVPADAPALPVVATLAFSPVPQPPFDFCLGGEFASLPSNPYGQGLGYRIEVKLQQRAGGSTVGDMMGGYSHLVELPKVDDRLVVTALELCDAKSTPGFYPGGFCLTENQ